MAATDQTSLPAAGVARLVAVMQRLRAADGCPWDREQSVATLRTYLIEESHELLDAIDGLGPAGQLDAAAIPTQTGVLAATDAAVVAQWREELGDVLLQVAFQSQIACEYGWFDLDRVATTIADKMVRRHPHVFDRDEASAAPGAADVKDRWEQQKRKEGKGALAGVPASLPGLLRAQRIGEKAARIGFDWTSADEVWPKIDEELGELREAVQRGDRAAVQDELGDLLFAVASLGRHLGADAELGLRGTLDRFTRRFAYVEQQAEARYGRQHKAPMDELEGWWQEAKRLERS